MKSNREQALTCEVRGSEGHRLRSKMTVEGLKLSLSITTNDVRGLWSAN